MSKGIEIETTNEMALNDMVKLVIKLNKQNAKLIEASAIDREKLVLEVDSLKKENEELGELLRETIGHCNNILSCCLSDTTQEKYAHDFLDRPEVKALLEKDKV